MQLKGIHHLTAITADASGNHAFYTRVLGMRLVKKTVNQDDVSAYHLFYADGEATPGSDLTFFDWPVARERRGTHSIIRTALRVAGEETLRWWGERLREHGLSQEPIGERDGRLTLEFEDAEGQRLALIDDDGKGPSHSWNASPVPVEHQIRGLGPISMSVPALEPTDAVLTGSWKCAACANTHSLMASPSMSMKWGKAGRLPSFMWPSSPACRKRGKGPEPCITSPSARRMTRNTEAGSSGCKRWEFLRAALSIASISAASISGNRTACCSRSRPTGQASRPMSRSRRLAKGCRFRHSSKAGGERSRPT